MAVIFPCGAAILLLLSLFLARKWKNFATSRKRLPPSPPSLPLIGHLHLLGRMAHRSLREISRKYGPIVYLKLGMIPTIVISSPEMARQVLQTHDAAFSSRPFFLVGKFFSYDFSGMGFTPAGDHWKLLRKICATELLTINRINSFAGVRMEEISRMVSSIEKDADAVIDVRKLLITYGFNVMTQTLMSRRFFRENGKIVDADQAREFKEVSLETVEMALGFHISEFVPPWLRWIDWNIPRVRLLQEKSDRFMRRIVDEHRQSQSLREVKDFMDVLLESFENQPRLKADNTVKALTMELLAGGTDTSASSIEWALIELLLHPEIMARAQDELVKAVDSAAIVNESDLNGLTYLQAIVKETMRLHPPAPLLVPHQSAKDCAVAGFHIPGGATTIVNVYAIGRDPDVWDDPLEFRPERFLAGDNVKIDVRGQNFELIPFGSGRRICPGMILGLRNVHLVLANLIHGFEWSMVPGREYGLEESFGTVNWPKAPLQARARRGIKVH